MEGETSTGEVTLHPLAAFLHRAGIETDALPVVRIFLHTYGVPFLMSPRSFVVRVPEYGLGLFESSMRVVRSLETLDSETHKRSHILELEWTFALESSPEEAFHPIFGALAAEATCPNCRTSFMIKPEILNPEEVRLRCSTCAFSWNLRLAVDSKANSQTPDLFSQYQIQPDKIRSKIEHWANKSPSAIDQDFWKFFPFSFEKMNHEDSNHFRALPAGKNINPETIIRGFANYIAFQALRSNVSRLTTEITEKREQSMEEIDEILETTTKRLSDSFPLDKVAHQEVAQSSSLSKFSLKAAGILIILSLGLLMSRVSLKSNATDSFQDRISVSDETVSISAKNEPSDLTHEAPKNILQSAKIQEVLKDTLSEPLEMPKKSDPKSEIKIASDLLSKDDQKIFQQAQIELKLQKFDSATKRFQDLISRNPRFSLGYQRLLLAQLSQEDFPSAIQTLHEFLKIPMEEQKKNHFENLLGIIEQNLKNLKAAE